MKFGPVPVADAIGAILAHSVRLEGRRLRKGEVLTSDHVTALAQAGESHVVVAQLAPGDIDENTAAARLAQALVPAPQTAGLRLTKAATGRANLIATGPGVVVLDVARLAALNQTNPMITLATVPPFQQLRMGGMAGTVKIISYAVPGADLDRACEIGRGAIRLAAPRLASATLIISEVPGGAGDKGVSAIRARLDALGSSLQRLEVVAHRRAAIAAALERAGSDLTLILAGSATSDMHDVAPEAARMAGGRIERFGMPVDPGNLLFLGQIGGRPVIGLPGCARSPALNGADWVLSRVVCGLGVTSQDIAAMGIGGLLKEIPSRPQPRAVRDD